MNDFPCSVLRCGVLHGAYHRIVFHAPHVTAEAKPGQFVHVRIGEALDHILRRPFSICDADVATGELTLVFKVVGAGTERLAQMKPGDSCRILGPLGTSYTMPDENTFPVIAAGGYGSASTLFLAKTSPRPGILFLGARTESDFILIDEYEALGWRVETATNDGSRGFKGFVTELMESCVSEFPADTMVYGCGPAPMLYALAKTAAKLGLKCEVSMDQRMGCGVGACFACVIKVVDKSSPDGWRYSRSCKEGVVYPATEVYCG